MNWIYIKNYDLTKMQLTGLQDFPLYQCPYKKS